MACLNAGGPAEGTAADMVASKALLRSEHSHARQSQVVAVAQLGRFVALLSMFKAQSWEGKMINRPKSI